MSLRCIRAEILQNPQRNNPNNNQRAREELKKILLYDFQHTRIKRKIPQGSKHLPINAYQKQHQKPKAKVKSKFIDNDEL